MKINHLFFASLLVLVSCTTPQERAAEQPIQPQQSEEVSQTTEYKPLAHPLTKDKFIQINIVVGDIYKAAKAWAALLDIPVPEVRTNHLEYKPEFPYTYRGKPSTCDLLVCDIDMGSWVLELHQADEKASSFREFYDKHGNGVHHLGFEVGDLRDEVIQELQGLGFNTDRTFGAYTGSSWTIVDSEDVLGVNLNIKPVK